MDIDPQQDPLRALFSELREADERRAPAFRDDWDAAMARRAEPTTIAWGRLAGAIVLLVLSAGFAMTLRSRLHHEMARQLPQRVPTGKTESIADQWTMADSLSEWHSPTAFLLAAPTDTSWPADSADEPDETAPARPDSQHL